ncbi:hypothetical protein DO628_09525 [Salmonella enterica subsp. salamae]|uniref:Uncharacterized protein n=1 Tax=Salmonella enterica TaxID=28901 RepID=A0A747TQ01_SALER|nr:hypothetical protein [Salmonella enterica subsp. salamae serovar Sofia]ECJ2286666.1 hypothetical protein [Salmonella enterica subsp. diarizonae]EDK0166767.1 hypothetical protein [Salmonella enterica]EDQ9769998.1 hypothetical protein [Salmonella enterica subsp. salamae]HDN4531686.1 hypothetical protein [Salmonella enterica subsp. enterica serovar Emmastad]
MKKPNAIILKLDGTKPSLLPMARLVKYMAALTELYGSADAVHFDSVSEGSADLNAWVDNDICYAAVIAKATLAAQENSNPYQRLTSLLEQDGFSGKLLDRNKNTVITFPYEKKDVPLYVTKIAEVQGRLYSVGGKDSSIPVRIEGANGETFKCEANPDIASSLGAHLFKHVRVKGESFWEKRDGKWELKKLKISSFTLLKKTSLKDAISSIKQSPGDQWSDEEDADSILRALRAINCE